MKTCRDVISIIELAGVDAVYLDQASSAIRYRPADVLTEQQQSLLAGHTAYILAHTPQSAMLTIPELRTLLGMTSTDGYHALTDTGKRRESLIAELEALTGAPVWESLTLEALQQRIDTLVAALA